MKVTKRFNNRMRTITTEVSQWLKTAKPSTVKTHAPDKKASNLAG